LAVSSTDSRTACGLLGAGLLADVFGLLAAARGLPVERFLDFAALPFAALALFGLLDEVPGLDLLPDEPDLRFLAAVFVSAIRLSSS
jgi:hypothetical protein